MPDEVSWIYALDELGIPMRAEYMALLKLLDFAKLKKLIATYLSRLGLDPNDLVLEQDGASYLVEWKKRWRQTFSEAHFLRLLFGPDMPTEPELKGFLPVRLWYWGMDSV